MGRGANKQGGIKSLFGRNKAKGAERDPNYYRIKFQLASAHLQQGAAANSEQAFQEAIETGRELMECCETILASGKLKKDKGNNVRLRKFIKRNVYPSTSLIVETAKQYIQPNPDAAEVIETEFQSDLARGKYNPRISFELARLRASHYQRGDAKNADHILENIEDAFRAEGRGGFMLPTAALNDPLFKELRNDPAVSKQFAQLCQDYGANLKGSQIPNAIIERLEEAGFAFPPA